MLLAVGAGTVAFIGIVFSLLFLTVQYSSTAFTPRLNLFRDAPIVWRAFALFTAVVVYSFTASLVIGRSRVHVGRRPRRRVRCCPWVARRVSEAADGGVQLHPARVDAGRGRGSGARGDRRPLHGPTGRRAEPNERDLTDDAGAPRGHWHEIRWPGHAATLQVIDVPRVLRAAERSGTTVRFRSGAGETLSRVGAVAAAGGEPDPGLGGRC